eukprot:3656159-Amphidinium_carterae.1
MGVTDDCRLNGQWKALKAKCHSLVAFEMLLVSRGIEAELLLGHRTAAVVAICKCQLPFPFQKKLPGKHFQFPLPFPFRAEF